MDTKKEGKEIAKRIATTFKNKSYLLKVEKRSHFFLRLYRTTNNKKYIKPTIEKFVIEKEDTIKDFNNLNNKKHIKKRSEDIFSEIKQRKEKKYKQRTKLFKNKKEVLFYYYIIKQLYFWKDFGLNKGQLKPHYKKTLAFIKKEPNLDKIKEVILNKEMIKYFGTQLVNLIYYLRYLDIINLEEEFTTKYKQVFKEEKIDTHFRNKIYGLTHFIIAESDYYQKFISTSKYDWILNYFKNNIKTILKRTNPDIASEVGLSFRLCQKEPKELELINKYLIENFNKDKGYIPRGNGSLNSSEHCAVVNYLFLSNFKKIFKGPDIHQEVDQYKNNLF